MILSILLGSYFVFLGIRCIATGKVPYARKSDTVPDTSISSGIVIILLGSFFLLVGLLGVFKLL